MRRQPHAAILRGALRHGLVVDQDDGTPGATLTEFEQMVVLLAREKVPDSTEPFATTLESFVGLIFVPTYRALLKKRGSGAVIIPA